VPWPGKNETQLYRRVLPNDYKRLAKPLGITGTVVVEASAWLEDNQWILELAQDEPFIKGFVGHLNPGEVEFPKHLKRFARHELFRGIRVSGADVRRLGGLDRLYDLRLLAEHDLSLDVNGGVDTLPAVASVARAVPSLRIIIDHVANVRIDGQSPPQAWLDGMREAAEQPNVFCKVSGLVEGSAKRGDAPRNLDFYRPTLDHVWHLFAPDRVIYGSNWPVSELFADIAAVHGLVKNYCEERGQDCRRFFAENARRAYKWVQR
jgi:predicted TIM-barrel fold metal-dependent hydrolase